MKVYNSRVLCSTKKAGQACFVFHKFLSLLFLSQACPRNCLLTVPLVPRRAILFIMLCSFPLVLVWQGWLLLCWLHKQIIPQKLLVRAQLRPHRLRQFVSLHAPHINVTICEKVLVHIFVVAYGDLAGFVARQDQISFNLSTFNCILNVKRGKKFHLVLTHCFGKSLWWAAAAYLHMYTRWQALLFPTLRSPHDQFLTFW